MGRRLAKKKPDYHWAVMEIDPGGTTGVSQALVPVATSIKAALRGAEINAYEVAGTHMEQCITMGNAYLGLLFRAHNELSIPLDRVVIAIESFQLRQRNVQLDPVIIRAMLEGLLVNLNPRIVEQTAGNAKGFATDERLRSWRLYQRGSEHIRDANRHVALYIAGTFGRS